MGTSIVSALDESIRHFIQSENRKPQIILMGFSINVLFIKEMIEVHRNYSIMENKSYKWLKIVTSPDIDTNQVEIY